MASTFKEDKQKFLSLLLQISWDNKLAFLDFHVSFPRVIYIYSRDLFSELFSDVVFHPDLTTCSFTKDFSNIFQVFHFVTLTRDPHVTLTRPFYRFYHVDARLDNCSYEMDSVFSKFFFHLFLNLFL